MKRKFVKFLTLSLISLPQFLVMPTFEGITAQVSAEETTPAAQADLVLDILADVYPNDVLPNYILTAETPLYLSAATTGRMDQDNFNIFYYAEDEPIYVDNKALNDLDPIASFNKTTYDTEAEAIEAVNRILDLQGQEVDLGYGLVGYMQGAAGSTYLNWQEGNWGLLVQANNHEGEDPVPLAKEVVEYLEEVFLSPPSDVGQISLQVSPSQDPNANVVIWNEGNVVYRVNHFDSMQAVRMAGSISEP